MDGNLEFRVLLCYLGVMYLFPVVSWRKSRKSVVVLGDAGARQQRARVVAMVFFLVPLLNYLVDGPWPWYPVLGLPAFLRWSAAIPATLALLLLSWACHQTQGGKGLGKEEFEKWFAHEGPYRLIRHPQLVATSLFFLSLAVLSDNGVVLLSTIFGVAMLRCVVAPAVEADLVAHFGKPYQEYSERTGSFFLRLRRVPKAKYTVPRRFGLFPVLALTTIFAILFGALNYMRASPLAYLFVATEISAICLAQIICGSAARMASVMIGAFVLPFWVAIALAAERNRVDSVEMIIGGAFLVVAGGFLGYLVGTLAAGFFLALDMLEPYLPGAKSTSLDAMTGQPEQNVN